MYKGKPEMRVVGEDEHEKKKKEEAALQESGDVKGPKRTCLVADSLCPLSVGRELDADLFDLSTGMQQRTQSSSSKLSSRL